MGAENLHIGCDEMCGFRFLCLMVVAYLIPTPYMYKNRTGTILSIVSEIMDSQISDRY